MQSHRVNPRVHSLELQAQQVSYCDIRCCRYSYLYSTSLCVPKCQQGNVRAKTAAPIFNQILLGVKDQVPIVDSALEQNLLSVIALYYRAALWQIKDQYMRTASELNQQNARLQDELKAVKNDLKVANIQVDDLKKLLEELRSEMLLKVAAGFLF